MRRRLQFNWSYKLFLCGALFAPLGCNKPAKSDRPFVGSWKMSNGAAFVFNADKTATVNGKPATWTEDKGILSLKINGRDAPMQITAVVSEDGKHLKMKRAGAKMLAPMEFEKQ